MMAFKMPTAKKRAETPLEKQLRIYRSKTNTSSRAPAVYVPDLKLLSSVTRCEIESAEFKRLITECIFEYKFNKNGKAVIAFTHNENKGAQHVIKIPRTTEMVPMVDRVCRILASFGNDTIERYIIKLDSSIRLSTTFRYMRRNNSQIFNEILKRRNIKLFVH